MIKIITKSLWQYPHSSKSKKKLKHAMMESIRAMNENIKNDELWKGRFYITCDSICYKTYEDGVGYAYAALTIKDKKTGAIEQIIMSDMSLTFLNGYDLWIWTNKFVNGCTIGE